MLGQRPTAANHACDVPLQRVDRGRHLFVVVSQAADGRDFVITAREMTRSERRRFREKGR